jgi:hypothetical protein
MVSRNFWNQNEKMECILLWKDAHLKDKGSRSTQVQESKRAEQDVA